MGAVGVATLAAGALRRELIVGLGEFAVSDTIVTPFKSATTQPITYVVGRHSIRIADAAAARHDCRRQAAGAFGR